MKRYLAFRGEFYYPAGGMGDFSGDFDLLEDACINELKWLKKKQPSHYEGCLWGHVYDTEERKIVWEYPDEDWI